MIFIVALVFIFVLDESLAIFELKYFSITRIAENTAKDVNDMVFPVLKYGVYCSYDVRIWLKLTNSLYEMHSVSHTALK